MAAEDYIYDLGDEYYDEYGVVCKFCDEPYLEWSHTKGIWTLVDEEGLEHNCRKYGTPASPKEFP